MAPQGIEPTPTTEGKDRARFKELLASSTTQAAQYLSGVHPADRAAWLLDTQADDAWRVYSELPSEDQAELIAYAEEGLQAALVERMSTGHLRQVLDELPSDEAADLLAHADERVAEDVLSAIDQETADDLRELSGYEPDTAGGIMATEFVTVSPKVNVGDAVKAIRSLGDDAEKELAVFVVDEEGRPIGFLPDRTLLSNPIHTPVAEAMVEPVTIRVDHDQEEAARLVEKYGLVSVGVVDNAGALVGVIAAEDVAEVLSEEAEEDLFRLVGANSAILHGRAGVLRRVRNRIAMMGVTVLSGLLSAFVLRHFLHQAAPLPGGSDVLRYLPLIIGLAGNVGVQSSTVLVRAMALGELKGPRQREMLKVETLVGVSLGLICGALLFGAVHLIESRDLGLAVGLATTCAMACAAMLGTGIPVLCQKLGIDPAIVAGPFLICVSDLSGSLIFMLVATKLLGL